MQVDFSLYTLLWLVAFSFVSQDYPTQVFIACHDDVIYRPRWQYCQVNRLSLFKASTGHGKFLQIFWSAKQAVRKIKLIQCLTPNAHRTSMSIHRALLRVSKIKLKLKKNRIVLKKNSAREVSFRILRRQTQKLELH